MTILTGLRFNTKFIAGQNINRRFLFQSLLYMPSISKWQWFFLSAPFGLRSANVKGNSNKNIYSIELKRNTYKYTFIAILSTYTGLVRASEKAMHEIARTF